MINNSRIMTEKFKSYINSASREDLDRILIMLNIVADASPDEMKVMKDQLKNDDFNVREWIDSRRPLAMEVV